MYIIVPFHNLANRRHQWCQCISSVLFNLHSTSGGKKNACKKFQHLDVHTDTVHNDSLMFYKWVSHECKKKKKTVPTLNETETKVCVCVPVTVCVCSVVLVQVIQEWVVLSPSTPQHLSSPFLLQKNRDRREESQPERVCILKKSKVSFWWFNEFFFERTAQTWASCIFLNEYHEIVLESWYVIIIQLCAKQSAQWWKRTVGGWCFCCYSSVFVFHTCWYCRIASFSCWIRLSSRASGLCPPGMM